MYKHRYEPTPHERYLQRVQQSNATLHQTPHTAPQLGYDDPLHAYMLPNSPPTHITRTIYSAGNRYHARLSPLAYTNLLQLAADLNYIRTPTPNYPNAYPTSQEKHRYISVFVNYALTYYTNFPYHDTRPHHIKQHDTTLLENNQLLPWSLETPTEEQHHMQLTIQPLTLAIFHALTIIHQIPTRSPRYALTPVPPRPVTATIQTVLEAIGLNWLTPNNPFPYAHVNLLPQPPKRRRPYKELETSL